MHALFLVVVLAAAEPPPGQVFKFGPSPLAFRGLALAETSVVYTPPPLAFGQFLRADSTPPRSSNLSKLNNFLPYSAELNALYQRYRADKRWRNGVGLTYTLGRQRRRWTIGLGPIQFTFDRDPYQPSR